MYENRTLQDTPLWCFEANSCGFKVYTLSRAQTHTHQPTKINLCAASYHLIKVAQ